MKFKRIIAAVMACAVMVSCASSAFAWHYYSGEYCGACGKFRDVIYKSAGKQDGHYVHTAVCSAGHKLGDTLGWCRMTYDGHLASNVSSAYCGDCGAAMPEFNCYHDGKTREGVPEWNKYKNTVTCSGCYAELDCCKNGHDFTDWVSGYLYTQHYGLPYVEYGTKVTKTCKNCGFVEDTCEHIYVTCVKQTDNGEVYKCNKCGFTSEELPYIHCQNDINLGHSDAYGYVCPSCGFKSKTAAASSCSHEASNYYWDSAKLLWTCNVCGHTETCAANGHKFPYKGTQSTITTDSDNGDRPICGLCLKYMDEQGGQTGGSGAISSEYDKLVSDIGKKPDAAINATISKTGVVTSNVLSAAKKNDVTVNFKVNDKFTWQVTGKNVSEEKDIDLAVYNDSVPIGSLNKNAATGCVYAMSFTLSDADFGKESALVTHFDEIYAGLFANVYKTSAKGELTLIGAFVIDEKGNAALTGLESEDYTVLVDYETKLSGDLDDSTRVNAKDATYLLKSIAKKATEGIPVYKADINGDGKITAKDASALLKKIASGEA